jgi:hypothetical protein
VRNDASCRVFERLIAGFTAGVGKLAPEVVKQAIATHAKPVQRSPKKAASKSCLYSARCFQAELV